MVKATKRKKDIFDYEADWVPQKGRAFMMKQGKKKEEQEAVQKAPGDKIKTDAEGEDRAYAQGDTYVEDDKLYVAGSHTLTDWFDDFTKIPQWGKVPSGFIDFIDLRENNLRNRRLETSTTLQSRSQCLT